MHQDRSGDRLAKKQLGIKGHRDLSGQAKCEPATCSCQEGQMHVGVRTTAASSPGEMIIPFYPAVVREHLEDTI